MRRLPPGMITVKAAIALTGLPRRTLHRRVDAHINGLTSPYAIVGQRLDDRAGTRCVDAVDAKRVRLQRLGELPDHIGAEAYARMVETTERDPLPREGADADAP